MHLRMRAELFWLKIQFIFRLNFWFLSLWIGILVICNLLIIGIAQLSDNWVFKETLECHVDTEATFDNLNNSKFVMLYLQCGEQTHKTDIPENIAVAYQNPQNLQCDVMQASTTDRTKLSCRALGEKM